MENWSDYQNAPHNQVNWAALAQQWMAMKDAENQMAPPRQSSHDFSEQLDWQSGSSAPIFPSANHVENPHNKPYWNGSNNQPNFFNNPHETRPRGNFFFRGDHSSRPSAPRNVSSSDHQFTEYNRFPNAGSVCGTNFGPHFPPRPPASFHNSFGSSDIPPMMHRDPMPPRFPVPPSHQSSYPPYHNEQDYSDHPRYPPPPPTNAYPPPPPDDGPPPPPLFSSAQSIKVDNSKSFIPPLMEGFHSSPFNHQIASNTSGGPPMQSAPPFFHKFESSSETDNSREQTPPFFPAVNLDATARKRLPAWILEGLEKAEREKQRQIEKEEKIKRAEAEKRERRALAGRGRFDSSSDEEESDVPRTSSRFSDDSNDSQSVPTMKRAFVEIADEDHRSEEDRLEEAMSAVKYIMTSLLMDATDGLFHSLIEEIVKEKLQKEAEPKLLAKSSALAALSSLGGDDDSDSSDNSDEAPTPPKEENFSFKAPIGIPRNFSKPESSDSPGPSSPQSETGVQSMAEKGNDEGVRVKNGSKSKSESKKSKKKRSRSRSRERRRSRSRDRKRSRSRERKRSRSSERHRSHRSKDRKRRDRSKSRDRYR